MTAPEFIIVGRVRKAHGIRGELVVEPITDAADVVFASGRRVFAGTVTGDPLPSRLELRVQSSRPFIEGLLIRFDGIADRTAADIWRGRYLLTPAGELPPPDENEIYVHDLIGIRVTHPSGEVVGSLEEPYQLAQV